MRLFIIFLLLASAALAQRPVGPIKLDDPNADRVMWWDDSEDRVDWMLPAEGRAWLDLEIGTDVQAYNAHLVDLADGLLPASKISIVDSGGYFDATTVEAALAEIILDGGAGGDSVSIDGTGVIDPNFQSTRDIAFFDDGGGDWSLYIKEGVVALADLDAAIQTSLGLADSSLQPGAIGVTLQGWKAVLDATTAAFTTADETKLDGIESGAQADLTGAEIKALYEAEADTNAFDDAAVAKLAGIEAAATADQSDAEIETAYNNQVAAASQAEMEAGTEAAIRRMSPLRVAQAIASLGGGSGDVTAAAAFGTDNRLIRSDGTGKGVKASGVTLDNSDNLTGFNQIDATTANVENLQFEGATADDFETVLTATDPTADRTVTLPDATGLLVLSGAIAPSDLANQAAGSVLYWNAGGSPTLLAPGTDNQVLTMNGVDSIDWSTLKSPPPFILALSDQESALAANTTNPVNDFVAPYNFNITYIAASVEVAPTGGAITVDVHAGAHGGVGTTVMNTDKVYIDATEHTTEEAATQPAYTTSSISDGDHLYFFIDSVGATETGRGLKLYIYYTRP